MGPGDAGPASATGGRGWRRPTGGERGGVVLMGGGDVVNGGGVGFGWWS